MKRQLLNSITAVATACVYLSLFTGCVMDPFDNASLLGPEPGSYYVEMSKGVLQYFDLADQRGEQGDWVNLIDEGDWYAGPGFYVLDELGDWSIDQDAVGLTLDEVIQLNDPAPAAPEE